MYAAGWTNVSDARSKHDISDLNYGLDLISRLKPVSFLYNNNTDGKKISASSPKTCRRRSAISGDTDTGVVKVMDESTGYLGLLYNDFIPVLTKGVQELDARSRFIQNAATTTV